MRLARLVFLAITGTAVVYVLLDLMLPRSELVATLFVALAWHWYLVLPFILAVVALIWRRSHSSKN